MCIVLLFLQNDTIDKELFLSGPFIHLSLIETKQKKTPRKKVKDLNNRLNFKSAFQSSSIKNRFETKKIFCLVNHNKGISFKQRNQNETRSRYGLEFRFDGRVTDQSLSR